jgi:hypothetical protein
LADVASNRSTAALRSYLSVLAAGLNECWAATLLSVKEHSVGPGGATASKR